MSPSSPIRLIAASFDVTERRQMLTQLSRFSHLFNSADDTVSSLLNRADSAMYRAKSRRDSSIEVVSDTDDTMHDVTSPDDSAEAPIR